MFTRDVLATARLSPGTLPCVHMDKERGAALKISDNFSCVLFRFLAMARLIGSKCISCEHAVCVFPVLSYSVVQHVMLSFLQWLARRERIYRLKTPRVWLVDRERINRNLSKCDVWRATRETGAIRAARPLVDNIETNYITKIWNIE